MKDRIKQVMEAQGMTQQTFANFIGLSTASVSGIFTGRTNPTLKVCEAIKRRLPSINLNWLLLGEGDMYETEGKDAPSVREQSPVPSEGTLDFSGHAMDSRGAVPGVSHPTAGPLQAAGQKAGKSVVEKPKRQVTEIRVFYDDLTYETFVPKR